jgi:hypothetical protein
MIKNDARTRVGDYVRLSWNLANQKLDFDEACKQMKSIGEDFSIDEAVKGLRGRDCYQGWEQELRYFMFRYEEHLSKMSRQNFKNKQWDKIWNHPPSESIEHILPQSSGNKKLVHRLGNLIMLPPNLNSKLQDKKPKYKYGDYRKTGLLIAEEVATTIESHGWGENDINNREKILLEWASKEWADS